MHCTRQIPTQRNGFGAEREQSSGGEIIEIGPRGYTIRLEVFK